MTDTNTREAVSTDGMTVGKFYRVPCVHVSTWHAYKGWLPVLGPMHEDAEFIGFKFQHFHLDWRFVPTRLWQKLGDLNYAGHHFAWPIQDPDGWGRKVILEGPALRLLKCKRDPGRFPVDRARWLGPLGKALACAKLVNGLCPHRGIPASAMHREGDVLTCPGHGLRWNAITGALVA